MTGILDLLLIWLHLLAAVAWLGGAVFIAVVYVPLLRTPEWRESASRILLLSVRRLTWLGWTCFGTLVGTGAWMLLRRGIGWAALADAGFWAAPFGKVLAWKLALVAGILAMSAAHDFWVGPHATQSIAAGPRAGERPGLVRAARWLGRLSLLCGLAVVALAAMLARGWSW